MRIIILLLCSVLLMVPASAIYFDSDYEYVYSGDMETSTTELMSIDDLGNADDTEPETIADDADSSVVDSVDPRLLLDTPFNDYTVTEGYLFLIAAGQFLGFLISVVKGGLSSW